MRIILLTVFLYGPLVHGRPVNHQSLVNSVYYLIHFYNAIILYFFQKIHLKLRLLHVHSLFRKIIVFEYFLVEDKTLPLSKKIQIST